MRGRTISVVMGLVLVASLVPLSEAGACAGSLYYFNEMASQSHQSSRFYFTTEGSTLAFTVTRSVHDCTPETGTATYTTIDGGAVAPGDYATQSNTFSYSVPGAFHEMQDRSGQITTQQDLTEEGLETFSLYLQSMTGGSPGTPRQVPAYVIDDDAASPNFEFQPGASFGQLEGTTIQIPVFRSGADVSQDNIGFTISSATADPEDYSPATGSVAFGDGQRVSTLAIDLADDGQQEPDETIQVTLDGSGSGTQQATVTILDDTAVTTETTNPRSRFHHPRHDLVYSYGDYRIREMHVFASDNLSGVKYVQMALRKKMTSGRCRWWKSGGFMRGPCKQKIWFKLKPPAYPDGPYYFRAPKLVPSKGTSVRYYTGFARAMDEAGNQEVLFTTGRNANTFEVKRG